MYKIATCAASAFSRIIFKGMLDSGHKGLFFYPVTSIDGKNTHPSAQRGLEIFCLCVAEVSRETLIRSSEERS